MTLRGGNTARDAVVQLTKMGLTFVLDRDTGEPIFPVHDNEGWNKLRIVARGPRIQSWVNGHEIEDQ